MAARTYYYSDSLGRSTSTSTTYATKVTLTFTPTSGKKYAIFWKCFVDDPSESWTMRNVRLRNSTDSVTYATNGMLAVAPSGTEYVTTGGLAIYTAADSSSHTFLLEYATNTGTNITGVSEAAILALELTDNDQTYESAGDDTSATGAYALKDPTMLAWTPGSSGDYLIVASAVCATAASSGVACQLYDGTTAYNDLSDFKGDGYDELLPFFAMRYATGLSAAQAWSVRFALAWGTGCTLRSCFMLALRLSDFPNAYAAEDRGADSTTSSTWGDTTTATITQTPAAFDHLVIASGIITSSAAGSGTDLTATRINAGGAAVGTVFQSDSPNTTAFNIWYDFAKRTETATSTVWKVQFARLTGAGTSTVDENCIAVLQLGDTSGSLEVKYPDSIAASTNLTGAVTDIDEDADSPDANWLTATSATAATDLRVTFPTPTGSPISGQNFKLWLRKTTGTPNPTITVEMRQANTLRVTPIAALTPVTSTSGQLFTASWTAADLVTVTDGSDVECRVVSVSGNNPGGQPVWSSSGTVFQSVTAAQTNTALNSPTHAIGDLLVVHVCMTNSTGNSVLTSVNGTGGTSGWTLQNNSGSMYANGNLRQAFGWKIAASTSEVCSIVTTSGATTDRIQAIVHKFTATNGFATAAIHDIGSVITGSSTSLGMPTIAAGGDNELAVALYGIRSSTTVANSTGETGGDWTEAAAEIAIATSPAMTTGIQTAAAAAMSGGTATLETTGVWGSVGFHVVPTPGAGAAVNTVEVGAIEWNVQYTPGAAVGQPMRKRWGGIEFGGGTGPQSIVNVW